MELDLNPQFQQALHLMENSNDCLFITGKAGTGKSTLLKHFSATTKKNVAILAPTGVAALNVKGQTIHRFFNFYIDVTPQQIREVNTKPRKPAFYKNLSTIIIDEASMLRADLLDCIDTFLQMYGPVPRKPFGGVQIIFIGDLYQLPPVVQREESEIFASHYNTPFFFSAHAFSQLEIKIVELEKVYRQRDQDFIDLLNRIRNNSVTQADILHLNSRHLPDKPLPSDIFYISLTTTNKMADAINADYLKSLKRKTFKSEAIVKGDFGKEYYPTAIKLEFKLGAQIMLLNNDPRDRWVNGSIGVIEALKTNDEGEDYLRVRLHDCDSVVSVSHHTWEVFKFSYDGNAITSEPIGTFTQFPFRLAWAVTIHKSQGKTFDHVIIDIGRGTFASGQMYVALSRCTSFKGVLLKTPIKPHHIRTDYRICEYLTNQRNDQAEQTFSVEQKGALITEVIAAGGQLNIEYLRADDTKVQCIVTPQTVGIAKYQGQEYLGMRAYCPESDTQRMFKVERILKLDVIAAAQASLG